MAYLDLFPLQERCLLEYLVFVVQPGRGLLETGMTADEVLVFPSERGNAIFSARTVQLDRVSIQTAG